MEAGWGQGRAQKGEEEEQVGGSGTWGAGSRKHGRSELSAWPVLGTQVGARGLVSGQVGGFADSLRLCSPSGVAQGRDLHGWNVI